MASTMRVVNIGCTFLLIAMFAMAGIMKLTPMISPEVHNELVGGLRGKQLLLCRVSDTFLSSLPSRKPISVHL